MNKNYATRINTALVTHVLLADGWHAVGRILPDVRDSALSFTLAHFLFDDEDNGMSKPVDGFYFLDDRTGLEIHGPLTSIRSVKVKGLYGAPLSRSERLWRAFRQSVRRLTAQPASLLLLLVLIAVPAVAQKPLHNPSQKQVRLEQWHRQDYQRPVDEAQKRLDAVQETLDLFLSAPAEKRTPYFDEVVASQRLLVEKYAGELKAAQDKLATFDRTLADPGARAVFHKQLKEQAKAAQVYRGPRFSVSIRCYSYSTRYTYRARCDVY